MPTFGSTSAVSPFEVVSSIYDISIEDPTIVGIVDHKKISIFACRNADCQDYNESPYLELKNQTFGRSISTTLTADSSLAILYTQTKPGGGYDLMLDVCKDPLCAIKGSTSHVASLTTDVDVWLGYDVNKGVPLIVVLDPHAQAIQSYSCDAKLACRAFPRPLVTGSTNTFSIAAYQTTIKKKIYTHSFYMTVAVSMPAQRRSEILTYQCANDLSSCSPPLVTSIDVSDIVTSVSAIATGEGQTQIAYTTFNATTLNATVSRAAVCKVGSACTGLVSRSFPLEFTPDETFTLTAQMLCSSDSGCTAIGLAANAFNTNATLVTSTGMYAIDRNNKTFQIEAKKYSIAQYHKPPPNVTIALFVLAGIAVASTIILVAWRIWVGRPPTPGYTQIN